MAKEITRENPDTAYLEIIKKMVCELRYGQINISIQDGKVIQIEQTKKLRI